jgi:metal transporter CNNM
MTLLAGIGIIACLSQSALLSGLNLGIFAMSRLELEVQAKTGDRRARSVLSLRERESFALVTILWSNVAVNVLLALLSGSVLSGVVAFLFSTVVITVFAEIIPQSYFSRHALAAASALAPVLRVYQVVFYPVARPTAWIIDTWLGGDGIRFYPERDLRQLIRLHMMAAESDIARVEGQGALNFLAIDDVPVDEEGELVDEDSIIQIPFVEGHPVFPRIGPEADDDFLRKVDASGKSWIVLIDQDHEPKLLLRSDDLIREALFHPHRFNPARHCRPPILVRQGGRTLGELLPLLRVVPGSGASERAANTAVLLWGERPRILTAADIMERLLRGITSDGNPPEG